MADWPSLNTSLRRLDQVLNDAVVYDDKATAFSEAVTFPGLGPPIFNGAFYGLVASPTADNLGALQALATAVGAAGGGVVDIGPGTFCTSRQVSFPTPCIIRGAGRGLTIFQRLSGSVTDGTAATTGAVICAGPTPTTLYTVGSRGTYFAIRDCTIDGNYTGNPGVTSNTPHADGLRLDFVDHVCADRVVAQNCLNSGFYYWGCQRTLTRACAALSNGHLGGAGSRNGFHVTGPQDDGTDRGVQDEHGFFACHGVGNIDEGWAIGRNGRITLIGNWAHDNGDMGIEGDSGTATSDTTSVPASWTLIGNQVYSNGTHGIGISNSNVQRIIAQANVIEDHPKCAFTSGFASGSLVIFSDNIIYNWGTASSGDHAVVIGTFDHAVVSDNELSSSVATLSTGIVFLTQATIRYVTVADNQVFGAGGGCLSITGKATGVVHDNLFLGTASASTDGVTVTGGANGIDGLDFHHNYVNGCVDDGFFIRTNGAGNVTNVRLRQNVSTGNGGDGFQFAESGGGTITGLVLDRNDGRGNTGLALNGLTAAMVALFDVSPSMSADRGDTNQTLTPGTDAPTQRWATALTANRTVTLATGFNGATFRVTRTGLGAFTLDVGGLKTIPAGTAAFVDVQHDGTAWRLAAYGTL